MPKTTERAETSAPKEVLYMAMDLGSSTWTLAFGDGQPAGRPRMRKIEAGDFARLRMEVQLAKRKFQLAPGCPVRSCYEAGRDGFWIHRTLVEHGVESLVVHPSSIEVARDKRRAKTDRIDARKMLSLLFRHHEGEHGVWKIVRVPDEKDEDDRRLARERERVDSERVALINYVKALLVLHGVKMKWRSARALADQLDALRTPTDRQLPCQTRREIRRALERLELVERQRKELQQERRALVAESTNETTAKRIQALMMLVGIGEKGAVDLTLEVFSRDFQNGKQVGAFAGLTGTPHQSDSVFREQGISKTGRPSLRKLLIQLAWGWLKHQPNSELSHWFQRKFAEGRRNRRIGITALARRLLVALWRYVEHGVVPEGVRFKKRLPAWAAAA